MTETRSHTLTGSLAGTETQAPEAHQSEEEVCRCLPIGEILESSSIAHFISREKRFLYVNPALETLTGFTKEELAAIDPFTFFSRVWEETGSEPGTPLPSPIETKIVTRNGEEKYVSVAIAPIKHPRGSALFGTVLDVTGHKQREEALLRTGMKYRIAFEFAPDLVIIYALDGTVIDISPVGAETLGVVREEVIGRNGPKEWWSEEDKKNFAKILENTLKNSEWTEEIKGWHKGRLFVSESRAKVAKVEDETFIVCIGHDITERKRLEEELRSSLMEKETLLREIHHRVKNNMQIISTLLKLQQKNTTDRKTKALFRESQNRILSMAMIHEKLYQSHGLHKVDLKDYIGDLAREVWASFGESSERVGLRTEVEDISLGLDTAIPCGLIIIELISNALKYAFPQGGGEIFIGLCSESSGWYGLTVSDNGVGMPEDIEIHSLKSLGLRLVSDLARHQLDGQMSISREHGTSVYVRFKEKEKQRRGNHYKQGD